MRADASARAHINIPFAAAAVPGLENVLVAVYL